MQDTASHTNMDFRHRIISTAESDRVQEGSFGEPTTAGYKPCHQALYPSQPTATGMEEYILHHTYYIIAQLLLGTRAGLTDSSWVTAVAPLAALTVTPDSKLPPGNSLCLANQLG